MSEYGKLENIPTFLTVVAAALIRQDGRFLLQKRPPGKDHAGLWEFPGGKVEAGETPAGALVREIKEELQLDLIRHNSIPAGFAESNRENVRVPIVILLYICRSWLGEPEPVPGAEIGWFSVAEAGRLEMPPLDGALLKQIAARTDLSLMP
ncbi:(deoxy)nucleoside triphosphate pyrophosphohydrolase [Qipengyuania atrilutea]|uniref:8-oxo-dGTP diphosphatase n=1 Tax=Qipengyuania atrilutea TaxID=2744473 RepID=A0A850GXF0_9SPHN|nr:(deoxy)nucleoside triphosphate pyrophosphohydrolase [Actirhodobacter atriluteus]NVD44241.1 (deoxy)nucleoside triphosphate pyrophosphohydrolase [Actirhodobacter atriluteus]